MITWEVVRDSSVDDVDISEGFLQLIETLLIQAGEFWGQYFDPPNDITLSIRLGFIEQQGDFLAFGGSSFQSIGTTAEGRNLVQVHTINEIATGVDTTPNDDDLFVSINFTNLDRIFFDSDISTSDDIPLSLVDAFSLFIHEIGHGLGFISVLGEATDVNNTGGNIDTFAQFIDFDGDQPIFTGSNAVEAFGGAVPLISNEDFIHLGAPRDLLQPTLVAGTRLFVTPLNIGILEDLGAPIARQSGEDDALFGFEFSQDSLSGLAGDDTLSGLGGNDTLRGEDGADQLFGGLGSDFIAGGAGDDTASGGIGNDEIFAGGTNSGDDLFVGGTGADTIGGGDGDDLLVGGNFDDGATNQVGIDDATGDGIDVIFGGAGNDTLLGGGFADTVVDNGTYNDGEAVIFGSDANTLFAGTGDDLVIGANGDDILGGGTGDDSLQGGAGNDTFFGGRGDDTDTGINDVITAGGGNDTVFSGAGNDSIDGGAGDDELFNGAGTDTVDAGAGNDTLFGGGGNDLLTGGVGTDTFAFVTGNGDDIITDFTLNDDTLDLSETATDFTDLASLEAAATNATQDGQSGLLIDTGAGDSIFLTGLTVDDTTSINIVF